MPENKKTHKKVTTALLLSALLSIVPAAGNSAGTYIPPAHNIIWESRLYRSIEFLSSSLCEGRATGTRGSSEAAFWIIRALEEAGAIPIDSTYAKHVYTGQGLVGHNIMGMIPGSRKNPRNSYIIIGTHYDHLGILDGKMYPGADENASGVVAAVSLAEMFSTMKTLGQTYGKNILFVFFDGRQMGLAGSQAMWRMLEYGELHDPLTGDTIHPEDISLMVNIEQIGSTLSPLKSGRSDYLIMLGNESLPRLERNAAQLCNTFYETGLDLAFDYYGSRNFTDVFYRISDQRVFIDNGIPSVVFTSGITMNTNRTYDSVHTLDMGILRRRIIFIFHWLERML